MGVVVAIALALAFAEIGILRPARSAWKSELELQAGICALRVLDASISANREWPKSWHELDHLAVANGPDYSWPKDADKIKALVRISFEDLPNDPASIQIIQSTHAPPLMFFEQRDQVWTKWRNYIGK
jgi:hypothetical protein